LSEAVVEEVDNILPTAQTLLLRTLLLRLLLEAAVEEVDNTLPTA